jgi:DNA-binding Lrp family transcriptional regulator
MNRRMEFDGRVSGDVVYDPTISESAKAVYLVLVMHRSTKDFTTSFPSNATISSYTGRSVRTTIRALNELTERGVIERVPQFINGRQVNSITLLTDLVSKRSRDTMSGLGG